MNYLAMAKIFLDAKKEIDSTLGMTDEAKEFMKYGIDRAATLAADSFEELYKDMDVPFFRSEYFRILNGD